MDNPQGNTSVNNSDGNDVGEGPPRQAAPRRRHAAVPRKVTWLLGRDITAAAAEEIIAAHQHYCGPLTDQCQFCGAKFFISEPRNRQGVRLNCCKNGAYALPPLGACPPSLRNLYVGTDRKSVQFRNQIRVINSLFAMASFKTSRPTVEPSGQGHWCFTVCGQIHHFTGGVPDTQSLNHPRLQHYYFLDADEALEHRTSFVGNRVDRNTLQIIETSLRSANCYMKAYRVMGETLKEEQRRGSHNLKDVLIGIVHNPDINIQRRNYDLPESRSDIAALFRGTEFPFNVDLKLYPQNIHHELKNLNPMADPMVYPILFPCGDNGYSTELVYETDAQKKVTFREFYRYRIQIRESFSTLHCGGKLFQQYLVDAWVKVESNMLWWFRQNQQKFQRAQRETLRRVNQARERVNVAERVERACILPTQFYGGARHQKRQYLDAMAVVAKHGKADLFVTFTCNPRWEEITSNLQFQQKWEHRPDLVCRVFHTKLLEFMDDIVHKQLYGVVLNYHYVIEFQKRGLPHAHIMVTFVEDEKILDCDSVDSIISATIPDKIAEPLLYKRVGDFHIHKPCGNMNPNAPCMRNNKCAKLYPKDYLAETRLRSCHNNRPLYKRPRDGRTVLVPETRVAVTNRSIVPYNRYALAKYAAHINFEAVGSVLSMKYLYKYVSKGPGTLVANSQGERDCIDEIQEYLDSRSVCSMEAAWRLLEYKMSDRSHAVLVLPVHLPGETVVLDEDGDYLENRTSKLDAWFTLNRISAEARALKYVEVPENYTWESKTGRWIRRRQVAKTIGCIAEVGPSPGQMEKHCLRILLCHARGALSFEHLRVVNGRVLHTFHEACVELNFLKHVDEFDRCLSEASLTRHPLRMRRLFALICCVATKEGLAQIPLLWRRHSRHFIEDLVHAGMNVKSAFLVASREIETILQRNKDVTLASMGISAENIDIQVVRENEEIDRPTPVDESEMEHEDATYDPSSLNLEQKKVFIRVIRAIARTSGIDVPADLLRSLGDEVVALVERDQETAFYLDGPGGTGKTYLYNTILATVRDVLCLATIAVAWTGIAASLLIGGTTAHRAFRLPVQLNDKPVAGWPLQHPRSRGLRKTCLIIWDEASMTPRLAVEAVDKYLREVTGNRQQGMGGIVTIFGGDFRQMLPVVIGGGRTEIMESTLKYSRTWDGMAKMRLELNMRADPAQLREELLGGVTFADWLLRLGEGRLRYVDMPSAPNAPADLIEIPQCLCSPTFEQLLAFVYEGDYTSATAVTKAILCLTNASVDKVNAHILHLLPGEGRVYASVDEYNSLPNDNFHVTTDVLNSVSSPSLPPHELILKVGAIVILLLNIDVEDGQCNGARMRITALHEHLVECELLSTRRSGLKLWVPRVKMSARDTYLPTEVTRIQFPLKLAYAITINKSQGQTMSRVGVYLNKPCFLHGQLYVAFSRVGSRKNFKVFMEEGTRQGSFKFRGRKIFTRNVVYHELLTDESRRYPSRDGLGEGEDNDIEDPCEIRPEGSEVVVGNPSAMEEDVLMVELMPNVNIEN